MKRAIHRAIEEELTERQKQFVILYYFEEKNMPEIAEELGVTKQNVSKTIKRGLNRIKNSKKIKKFLESA